MHTLSYVSTLLGAVGLARTAALPEPVAQPVPHGYPMAHPHPMAYAHPLGRLGNRKPKTSINTVKTTLIAKPSSTSTTSKTSTTSTPKPTSTSTSSTTKTSSTSIVSVPSSVKVSATVGTPITQPTTSSIPISNDPPQSFIDAVLRHHNIHRANHSAADLTWSQPLAETAKKIAAKCIFAHDMNVDGGAYGQNLAAGVPQSQIGRSITDLFYNSEMRNFAPYYGQPTPGGSDFNAIFGSFGHFTQVVWKGTSTVGCYVQDCSASGWKGGAGGNIPPYLTVCNYKGQGNFLGSFDTNVGTPLGRPTVNGDF